MSLETLARTQPFAGPLRVPEWTLGCFKRRSITYATGAEDVTTDVIWIQSHGLTGDLRIPAARRRPAAQKLIDCTREDFADLARSEGFAARTAWADGVMSWDTVASFQPYEKWPEPGRLERVGASLIEWAPSGVYVEDWRLQPGSDGLSVGLSLEAETGLDGAERPRAGGLVIAGDHALRIIGRRGALPERPLHTQFAEAGDLPSLVRSVFDCDISYARRGAQGYRVSLAADPFQQGAALFSDDAFAFADEGYLIETAPNGQPWRKRLWRIDTLLADQRRPIATPAAPEGLDWLARERDTLPGT